MPVSTTTRLGVQQHNEKMQQLEQIKVMREKNKVGLRDEISKECQISDEKDLYVISGQSNLVEIEANNPFHKE